MALKQSVVLGACSLGLSLSFSGVSLAEPPPPAGPPVGKINLTTPAPAPSVPRSYHMHDGFYARGSIGFGSLGVSFDDGDPSGDNLSGSGPSLGFDLMFGGSPSPGIAIGGGLLTQGAFSVNFERNGYDVDRSVSMALIGPFIDGFPNANKGWHFGGLVGLAAVNVEDDNDDGLSKTGGFGGSVFLGYDFWVADEWSVGPLVRFTGALTKDDDGNVDAQTFSSVVSFTALYH
jgi:hypothetical protein